MDSVNMSPAGLVWYIFETPDVVSEQDQCRPSDGKHWGFTERC
jgi:hypothetical protein